MAKIHHQPNKLVNREKAEIFQEKLFAAATTALDLAMAEEKTPGNLLSVCQSILRDSGLAPDLSSASEADEVEGADPSWLKNIAKDLGV